MEREKQLIIVRGGGDIATGTIHRLLRCGYPVLVLETEKPTAIRRLAAFSEAVYEGSSRVDGETCRLAGGYPEAVKIMEKGEAAMLVDPECRVLEAARPFALVDAILAKKNLGTRRDMAEITVALGPGFTAGEDVDLVVETMRGHNLGRVIRKGSAMANTGVPGLIGGYGKERVIHAPAGGVLKTRLQIGDMTEKGELLGWIEKEDGNSAEVRATLSGLVRGMLRDGFPVVEGMKMADIDPRKEEYGNCFTISDKARCIAGGVLEGILSLERRRGR